MTTIIRAAITGPEAEPGRIAAADVARLIVGLERAIARAAYVALRRERRAVTGRHIAAIERAARLRFIGVESGSFVELLALPESGAPSEDELLISVNALSSAAFDQILVAINDIEKTSVDQQLAAAIAQLAEELGIGDRAQSVTISDSSDDSGRRRAVIDQQVRVAMQQISRHSPEERSDVLVGRLVEADFERYTARLQPPTGGAVTVPFPAELSDEIQEALRRVAMFEGLVSYDPRTSVAKSVQLQAVSHGEQLTLEFGEFGEFWQHRSIEDLREAQGIRGPVDVDDLYDADLSDEEREALYTALIRERAQMRSQPDRFLSTQMYSASCASERADTKNSLRSSKGIFSRSASPQSAKFSLEAMRLG